MLKVCTLALAFGAASAEMQEQLPKSWVASQVVDEDDEIEILPFPSSLRRLAQEEERAAAMSRLQDLKKQHKSTKKRCKKSGKPKTCKKQQELEEEMLALNAKWRAPAREGGETADPVTPEDAEKAKAMETLRELKKEHETVKARCQKTGNDRPCEKQQKLEEQMLILSAKYREPAREDGRGQDAGESPVQKDPETYEEAMVMLRQMKDDHRVVKATCRDTRDRAACAEQQRLETKMLEMSAKWRRPAREGEVNEESERAEAMETLKRLKEEHKTVKATCKETGDRDACAQQQGLEARMLALSAKYREPAREGTTDLDSEKTQAMANLRQMKEDHKMVKAACRDTRDVVVCAEQERLEAEMLELSAIYRDPAREGQTDEDSEKAEAMETLRQLKAEHREVKATCRDTRDADACAQQQELESQMLELSAKWRAPARDEGAEAMEQLRDMKAAHKTVKAACLESGDEIACAEQADLEEEMLELSAKWRGSTRN